MLTVASILVMGWYYVHYHTHSSK